MVLDERGQQTGKGGERVVSVMPRRNGNQQTIRALRSKVQRE